MRKGNAKSYLNEKKAQAVDSLNSRYWVGDSYASLAKTISNAIIELPDINEQTLDTCLNWVGQIKDSYSEQLEDVQKTIQVIGAGFITSIKMEILPAIANSLNSFFAR